MRSAWQNVALGDICELKYGKSLPENSRRFGDVPVYGSNGQVGRHDRAVTAGKTIIVGRKGSFGEVNFSVEPCWPIDTTYYIDCSATKADVHWLSYRLRGLGLNKLNRAAAVPGLNREDAYRQRLLLPPLTEQRRIAKILDKADKLRDKRRAALSQLDTLSQAIFLDMFGDPVRNPKWPIQHLGSVVESLSYGPRFYNEVYADDGVRVVRISDLTENGSLDFDTMPKLALSEKEFKKSALRAGDVIFARSGATVGKTAVVRETDPPCIAGAYFIVMRFDDRIEPVYARSVLSSTSVREIVARRSRQAAQQNFSGPGLRQLPVPIPPLSIQRGYAAKLEAIDRFAGALRSSQREIERLFASLQHRAFRGEL